LELQKSEVACGVRDAQNDVGGKGKSSCFQTSKKGFLGRKKVDHKGKKKGQRGYGKKMENTKWLSPSLHGWRAKRKQM